MIDDLTLETGDEVLHDSEATAVAVRDKLGKLRPTLSYIVRLVDEFPGLMTREYVLKARLKVESPSVKVKQDGPLSRGSFMSYNSIAKALRQLSDDGIIESLPVDTNGKFGGKISRYYPLGKAPTVAEPWSSAADNTEQEVLKFLEDREGVPADLDEITEYVMRQGFGHRWAIHRTLEALSAECRIQYRVHYGDRTTYWTGVERHDTTPFLKALGEIF